MTVPGNQGSVPPRPEWRATLATLVLLLITLCLCVIVVGARGQGDGLSGAILRRFARVPLLGRLVQPLLGSTPVPDAPSLQLAAPPPAPQSASTSLPNQYLVRPAKWPTGWPWPPGPKDQPAAVPAAQSTAAPEVQPTVAPAEGPNLSPEEQKKELGDEEKGPVG
jgi:hypothetical protein